MSNYLTRLATRISHPAQTVQPRLAHRFEQSTGIENLGQISSGSVPIPLPSSLSLPRTDLSAATALAPDTPNEAGIDQSVHHVFSLLPDREAPEISLSLPLRPAPAWTAQATVPNESTLTPAEFSIGQTDFDPLSVEAGDIPGLSAGVTKPHVSPLRASRLPTSNASASDSSELQIQSLSAVTQQPDHLIQPTPQFDSVSAPDSHPASIPSDGKGFLEALSNRAARQPTAAQQITKERTQDHLDHATLSPASAAFSNPVELAVQQANVSSAIAPAAVFPQKPFEGISEHSNFPEPEPTAPKTEALTGRAALRRTATHTIQPTPILQSTLPGEPPMVAPEASSVGAFEQSSPLLVPLQTQGVQWASAVSAVSAVSAIAPVQPVRSEQPAAPPQPQVNVSIGRIEVRMTPPPRRADRTPRRASQAPVTSLSDYLRSGGQR